MKLADRLIAQLRVVRDTAEQMLKAFQAPDEWTHQVAPGTNHALWFAGHMATGDNWLIHLLAPDRAKPMDDWNLIFSMGSKPTDNPDAYPPPTEVLDAMRERRATVIEILGSMSDQQLSAPAPEDMPGFVTDVASLVELTIWHEAMHLGQVSVVRRALGNAPLFDPAAAEAGTS
jgi:uncharacterized damage-inducible protein DinB